MSKEIMVADAKDWSKEEADFNLHYLDDRGRMAEAEQVREALGLDSGQFPASEGPAPTTEPDPTAGQTANVDLSSMNVDETKEWVGEDEDRAGVVYDFENSKADDKKRSTLIEWLEASFEFEE